MSRRRPRFRVSPIAPGVAVVACALGLACAGPAREEGRQQRPAGGLEATVEPAARLPPEAFVPLAAPASLGPTLGDLGAWWDRFFRPEASPRRAETVLLSARAAGDGAPDLVLATYEMAVARLEVLDAPSFTLVRVADPGVDVAEGAAAQVMVRRILALGPDRSWGIRLPARLAEGVWYTSSARATGAVASWRDRLDVRVQGGRLELLCVKQGEGPRPAPGGWFAPELRSQLTRGR
ncbi:MAG: hypothetical protein QM767_01330 [Anaeromyxobacter sp.]